MFNFHHLFLFLGRLCTVILPIAPTILICLIVSFGAMYLFGLSINVITLLALVLSIGLVVDDAIVMLEKFIAILRVVKTPNSNDRKEAKRLLSR